MTLNLKVKMRGVRNSFQHMMKAETQAATNPGAENGLPRVRQPRLLVHVA